MKIGVARLTSLALAGCAFATIGPAFAQTNSQSRNESLSADWSGWIQTDGAYTYASPAHVSKARIRAELTGKGQLSEGLKWKLSTRASYDAAFDATRFYPSAVRRDQSAEFGLREAYMETGSGNWEFRLGKQHIIWGEMVGLFFADVVSAKDLREFILPDFGQIRIPQWAARAEWFAGDSHLEFVWLPSPAIDRIGEPGSEFYPYPARFDGVGYTIDREKKPTRSLANGGFGVRGSALVGGWDLAAFLYRAPDSSATFERLPLDTPVQNTVYQARHDRITRAGGTLSKDFDGVVGKAEMVYTTGRRFSRMVLDASDGLTRQDTVDWVAGVDFTPADDWRVNSQLYQRIFLGFDPVIGFKRIESGASLLVAHSLTPALDLEFLGISSLVRSDWMARASMTWKAGRASRVKFGVDAFGGQPLGLFGRYANRDRVYAEYRYTF